MSVQEICMTVATVLGLIAFIPYLVDIVRGGTYPHRATWLVEVVNSTVLCLTYEAAGAAEAYWYTVAVAAGCVVTFMFSLWRGVGGLDKESIITLSGATVAGIIWWVFDSPMIALAMGIAVDTFGMAPTILKIRRDGGEDLSAWSIAFVASGLTLFGLTEWSLTNAAYPVYAFGMYAAVVSAIVYQKRR